MTDLTNPTLDVAVVPCDGPVDIATSQLEDVWLPRLGPTATLAWRLLVARGTGKWNLNVLARHLGVPPSKARHALERLEVFGIARLSPQGPVLCVAIMGRGLERPARSAYQRAAS